MKMWENILIKVEENILKSKKQAPFLRKNLPLGLSICLNILTIGSFVFIVSQNIRLKSESNNLAKTKAGLEKELTVQKTELDNLKNQDQLKKNNALETEIGNINKTFKEAIAYFEKIDDLIVGKVDSVKIRKIFANILKLLSEKKYQEAKEQFPSLEKEIKIAQESLSKQNSGNFSSLPVNNTPPSAGYSRQNVAIDSGTFAISIISANMNNTKIIVDTASESDCTDNCPVIALSDYASRNGAFAGINGTYFCPATYPDCQSKKNSFDLLAMNKNKKYFNSDNNVYSTNPAVIFLGNSIRFVRQALEWGRDTAPDGVISNYPLLIFNSQIAFGGDGFTKHSSKGGRSFVAAKGANVYIGVVHSATVLESAKVLSALGMENAMNLDDGGSTALWFGGYKVGPGRSIPNAILFVKK